MEIGCIRRSLNPQPVLLNTTAALCSLTMPIKALLPEISVQDTLVCPTGQ